MPKKEVNRMKKLARALKTALAVRMRRCGQYWYIYSQL